MLNSGLAVASHDLICTIDGDSRLRADSLTEIVERFLSDPPGTWRSQARCWSATRGHADHRAQEWDYFHGISAVKRMQSMYHGTLVAQGAFSLYAEDALEAVGGWPESVGEDIVMTWAMLQKAIASAMPRTRSSSPMRRPPSGNSTSSANAGRAA